MSALGTTVPARLLQEALVICVFNQMSQFGSFGKCVFALCVPEPGATFARDFHEKKWQYLDAQVPGLPVALKDHFHQPNSF